MRPFMRKVSVLVMASSVMLGVSTSSQADTRPVVGNMRWICVWGQYANHPFLGPIFGNKIRHQRVFMQYNERLDKDTPQWMFTKMDVGPTCSNQEAENRQVFVKKDNQYYYPGEDTPRYSD